jgi:Tol biopolymer transport system component
MRSNRKLNSKLSLRDIPYKIVYESYQETGDSSNWEICMINADGSNFINLTKTPDINEFYPHASPDGTKICFVAVEGDTRENRSRNIYFMDIDGSGLTKIADNAKQHPNPELAMLFNLCWSPDGKYLTFSYGPSSGNQAVGRKAAGSGSYHD